MRKRKRFIYIYIYITPETGATRDRLLTHPSSLCFRAIVCFVHLVFFCFRLLFHVFPCFFSVFLLFFHAFLVLVYCVSVRSHFSRFLNQAVRRDGQSRRDFPSRRDLGREFQNWSRPDLRTGLKIQNPFRPESRPWKSRQI